MRLSAARIRPAPSTPAMFRTSCGRHSAKREANNWLNEGPEQEFMQQLNDLGNMNLLNAGGGNRGTLQNPALPTGGGQNGGGSGSQNSPQNINDRLFNLNDHEIDDLVGPSQGESLQNDTAGVDESFAAHAARVDRVAVTPLAIRRLPRDDRWAAESNVAAAAVAGWMLVTGNRDNRNDGRDDYIARRARPKGTCSL